MRMNKCETTPIIIKIYIKKIAEEVACLDYASCIYDSRNFLTIHKDFALGKTRFQDNYLINLLYQFVFFS